MRTVRRPRRELSQPIDIIRDLQDVIADIAHAINTHETIFPVSGTTLDGPGGGGGGAAHAILSATHTDSVGNAVTRGSLIYGNATPAWDELVLGAVRTVLRSDGTDAAWSTGDLDSNARVTVRKNTGANVGTRRRLNLIEGTNVTLTVTDDAGGEEVDITVASSAGGGTVTSVAGGVGITNTPEPIVGAGTVDLDIFSLTTEAALAAGDWLPFVDVSVGTAPSAQRKATFANLEAALTLSNQIGPLSVGKGGTGLISGTSGGILGFTGTTTIASSALLTNDVLVVGGGAGATPNAIAAGLGTTTQVLHGNAAGEPTWAAVSLTADITGTLAVGNGGTGLISGTSGGILGFTGTTTIASSALLTNDAIVVGGGAGATPNTIAAGLGTTTTVLHGNAAGEPTWAAVSLTADVSGTLPIGSGGTGQITAVLAFNALSPITTRGDLITRDATVNNVRLAIGTTGRFLRSDGTDPSWQLLADADIPNTITLDNITQITTRDHGDLQDLLADDHTQYLLLAGRAGGQVGTGGTAAGNNLTLRSNTGFDGTIRLGDSNTGADAVVIHGTTDTLGINGVTQTVRLTVRDQTVGAIPMVNLQRHEAAAATGVLEVWSRSRGNAGTPTVVANDDTVGELLGVAFDGTDYERVAAMRYLIRDTNPSATSMGGEISFFTTTDGTVTLAERFRLSEDGARFQRTMGGDAEAVGDFRAPSPVTPPAYPSYPEGIFIGDTTDSRVSILTGNAGLSILDFSDTDAIGPGAVTYNHTTNLFTHRANATDMLTLGSVGLRIESGVSAAAATRLDVRAASAVTPAAFGATPGALIVGDTTSVGLELSTGTSGLAEINFSDTAASGVGAIKYDHTGDFLRLTTGSVIQARLNTTGLRLESAVAADAVQRLHVVGNQLLTGILYGGTATADNIDLDPSSAANYTGSVRICTTATTVPAGSSLVCLRILPSGMTWGAGVFQQLRGLLWDTSISITGGSFGSNILLFTGSPRISNTAGITVMPGCTIFHALPIFESTVASLTTALFYEGFESQPSFVNTLGSLTVTPSYGYRSSVLVWGATTTIEQWTHYEATDLPAGGTLTAQIAFSTNANTGTTCISLVSSGVNAKMRHVGPIVVGANADVVNTSVIMDFQNTTQAIRLPRLTHTTREGLTGLEGMFVHDTTYDALYFYRNPDADWYEVAYDAPPRRLKRASVIWDAASILSNVGVGAHTPSGTNGTAGNNDGFWNFRTTAASANDDAGWLPITATYQVNNNEPSIYYWRIRTSTSIAVCRIWVGMFTADPMGSDTLVANSVGFRYSTAAGDTTWSCRSSDGASVQASDSGITVATSTLYEFKLINRGGPGTPTWDFYINGNRVATHTTTVPSAVTIKMQSEIRTLEAVVKGILLSHWYADTNG
jgi:hypothetical protein